MTRFGDLRRAPGNEVIAAASDAWGGGARRACERRRNVRGFLSYLDGFPGQSWQQRWEANPYAAAGLPRRLPDATQAQLALKMLMCLRVIQPSLTAVSHLHPEYYAQLFREAQDDPALDAYFDAVEKHAASVQAKRVARYDIARALTVFGIGFAELTPAALLQYSWDCRHGGVVTYQRGEKASFAARLAWIVLNEIGHFPPGTPPTIRAAGMRGQMSITEQVDVYPIQSPQVRQLLIDYLQRRALNLDYSTLRNLVRHVAGHFWHNIEKLAPGFSTLAIPGDVYDQWRQDIQLRHDGRERLSVDPILLAVRSMYLDLHTWSAAEPHLWAHWIMPCPVRPGEFAESGKRERRRKERSHQRTRERQPLLPILVSHLRDRLTHLRLLLAKAAKAKPGKRFTIEGQSYTRVWTDYDQTHRSADPVRVTEQPPAK